MKSNPNDDELLRSYLLGQLPEDEADRLEGRLLTEDDLFELSEAVEADLLADYAQGGLAPAERERVQRRLASSPQGRERLMLARSLSKLAGRDRQAAPLPFTGRTVTPRRPALRWAALAAGLFVAAGLGWIALEQQGHRESHEKPAPPITEVSLGHEAPPPQHKAVPPAPAPAPEPVKAVFQLALTSLRGAEAAEKLRVPAGAGTVELQISVEGMDDLKSFHLTVRNRKGRTVKEWTRLKPRNLNRARVLVVEMPAERLPAGRYEIQAQGLTPGGEPEDLSPLEVVVVRGKG
ncbi:MAG: anti-sigma factor family protein [Thermoanaerobaculia bacterium]